MDNRTKIAIAILLAVSIIIFAYTIFWGEETPNKEIESDVRIAKNIEDECTEEYEKIQNATTVASAEEKLSANAILILKKYYQKCDHTINEYVELPQELVNLTEEEVQEEYPDWEVIGFESGKLTLYKEFENGCGEHFKLRVKEGKVVIYIVNDDSTETIYEKTNISSEYLTETDLLNMQDGLDIFSKEELNQIIEDFE